MNKSRFNKIIKKLNDISIVVLGDYFVDKYLYVDSSKDEKSYYANCIARQVVNTEVAPGAAGTVAKNLVALGVGKVYAVGFIGNDGNGYELKRELKRMKINCENIIHCQNRITPAYIMLMTNESGKYLETSELDIKNMNTTPVETEQKIVHNITMLLKKVKPSAVILLDQLSEENHGTITKNIRNTLSEMSNANKDLIVYADSRNYIHDFKNMIIKCNESEFMNSSFYNKDYTLLDCCMKASKMNNKPVIITLGERGSIIADNEEVIEIPSITNSGPIDTRGAGDAYTAAFVSTLCCGATLSEAGHIGNISASICVSYIGMTGTATVNQIREYL